MALVLGHLGGAAARGSASAPDVGTAPHGMALSGALAYPDLDFLLKAAVEALYPEDEFGDPNTNGYNHRPHKLDRDDGMRVPLTTRTRVRRKKEMAVSMKTRLDGSSQIQLGAGQMEDKFNDIKASFMNMFKATGTSSQAITSRKTHAALANQVKQEPADESATCASVPSSHGAGPLQSSSNAFCVCATPLVPLVAPSEPPRSQGAGSVQRRKRAG